MCSLVSCLHSKQTNGNLFGKKNNVKENPTVSFIHSKHYLVLKVLLRIYVLLFSLIQKIQNQFIKNFESVQCTLENG